MSPRLHLVYADDRKQQIGLVLVARGVEESAKWSLEGAVGLSRNNETACIKAKDNSLQEFPSASPTLGA